MNQMMCFWNSHLYAEDQGLTIYNSRSSGSYQKHGRLDFQFTSSLKKDCGEPWNKAKINTNLSDSKSIIVMYISHCVCVMTGILQLLVCWPAVRHWWHRNTGWCKKNTEREQVEVRKNSLLLFSYRCVLCVASRFSLFCLSTVRAVFPHACQRSWVFYQWGTRTNWSNGRYVTVMLCQK